MREIQFVKVPPYPITPHADRTPGDINMGDWQLAFIEKLAAECPFRRFLEVGVYMGVTTTLLARLGPTVAVDWFVGNVEFPAAPWNYTVEDQRTRLGGFLFAVNGMGMRERVTILTGKSDDVLPLLKNDRFGLVLVDADHSEDAAYRDIANVWDLIVTGGFLLLDDWTEATIKDVKVCTVRRAWERFLTTLPVEPLALTADEPASTPKLVAIQKP